MIYSSDEISHRNRMMSSSLVFQKMINTIKEKPRNMDNVIELCNV